MQVTTTSFTVAEYADQLIRGVIIVNRDYQRSSRVWPPAARSYLIDTLLLGYPMPKLSLYQKTDLRTRTTLKEIVDGQQRSEAILQFFQDRFRVSGPSIHSGKRYSQLEEPEQQAFINYQLTADIFVGATDADIRQVFRRMNSYNVPLNAQEQRHAEFQGELKWFVVDLAERYAQTLKDIGVFTESQLSRMADAELFSDLSFTMIEGISSASEPKLDAFYRSREATFPERIELNRRFDDVFGTLLGWEAIHRGPLMRSYNFYTLFLALAHVMDPLPALMPNDPRVENAPIDRDVVLTNLGTLAEAIEQPGSHPQFSEFVEATSKATNRINQRLIRFKYLCQALEPRILT